MSKLYRAECARQSDGQESVQNVTAESEADARLILRRRGFLVARIAEAGQKPAAAAGVSAESTGSFWAFERFVTPFVAQVLFVLVTIGCALFAIGIPLWVVLSSMGPADPNASPIAQGLDIGLAIFAPLGAAFGWAWTRLMLENAVARTRSTAYLKTIAEAAIRRENRELGR